MSEPHSERTQTDTLHTQLGPQGDEGTPLADILFRRAREGAQVEGATELFPGRKIEVVGYSPEQLKEHLDFTFAGVEPSELLDLIQNSPDEVWNSDTNFTDKLNTLFSLDDSLNTVKAKARLAGAVKNHGVTKEQVLAYLESSASAHPDIPITEQNTIIEEVPSVPPIVSNNRMAAIDSGLKAGGVSVANADRDEMKVLLTERDDLKIYVDKNGNAVYLPVDYEKQVPQGFQSFEQAFPEENVKNPEMPSVPVRRGVRKFAANLARRGGSVLKSIKQTPQAVQRYLKDDTREFNGKKIEGNWLMGRTARKLIVDVSRMEKQAMNLMFGSFPPTGKLIAMQERLTQFGHYDDSMRGTRMGELQYLWQRFTGSNFTWTEMNRLGQVDPETGLPTLQRIDLSDEAGSDEEVQKLRKQYTKSVRGLYTGDVKGLGHLNIFRRNIREQLQEDPNLTADLLYSAVFVGAGVSGLVGAMLGNPVTAVGARASRLAALPLYSAFNVYTSRRQAKERQSEAGGIMFDLAMATALALPLSVANVMLSESVVNSIGGSGVTGSMSEAGKVGTTMMSQSGTRIGMHAAYSTAVLGMLKTYTDIRKEFASSEEQRQKLDRRLQQRLMLYGGAVAMENAMFAFGAGNALGITGEQENNPQLHTNLESPTEPAVWDVTESPSGYPSSYPTPDLFMYDQVESGYELTLPTSEGDLRFSVDANGRIQSINDINDPLQFNSILDANNIPPLSEFTIMDTENGEKVFVPYGRPQGGGSPLPINSGVNQESGSEDIPLPDFTELGEPAGERFVSVDGRDLDIASTTREYFDLNLIDLVRDELDIPAQVTDQTILDRIPSNIKNIFDKFENEQVFMQVAYDDGNPSGLVIAGQDDINNSEFISFRDIEQNIRGQQIGSVQYTANGEVCEVRVLNNTLYDRSNGDNFSYITAGPLKDSIVEVTSNDLRIIGSGGRTRVLGLSYETDLEMIGGGRQFIINHEDQQLLVSINDDGSRLNYVLGLNDEGEWEKITHDGVYPSITTIDLGDDEASTTPANEESETELPTTPNDQTEFELRNPEEIAPAKTNASVGINRVDGSMMRINYELTDDGTPFAASVTSGDYTFDIRASNLLDSEGNIIQGWNVVYGTDGISSITNPSGNVVYSTGSVEDANFGDRIDIGDGLFAGGSNEDVYLLDYSSTDKDVYAQMLYDAEDNKVGFAVVVPGLNSVEKFMFEDGSRSGDNYTFQARNDFSVDVTVDEDLNLVNYRASQAGLDLGTLADTGNTAVDAGLEGQGGGGGSDSFTLSSADDPNSIPTVPNVPDEQLSVQSVGLNRVDGSLMVIQYEEGRAVNIISGDRIYTPEQLEDEGWQITYQNNSTLIVEIKNSDGNVVYTTGSASNVPYPDLININYEHNGEDVFAGGRNADILMLDYPELDENVFAQYTYNADGERLGFAVVVPEWGSVEHFFFDEGTEVTSVMYTFGGEQGVELRVQLDNDNNIVWFEARMNDQTIGELAEGQVQVAGSGDDGNEEAIDDGSEAVSNEDTTTADEDAEEDDEEQNPETAGAPVSLTGFNDPVFENINTDEGTGPGDYDFERSAESIRMNDDGEIIRINYNQTFATSVSIGDQVYFIQGTSVYDKEDWVVEYGNSNRVMQIKDGEGATVYDVNSGAGIQNKGVSQSDPRYVGSGPDDIVWHYMPGTDSSFYTQAMYDSPTDGNRIGFAINIPGEELQYVYFRDGEPVGDGQSRIRFDLGDNGVMEVVLDEERNIVSSKIQDSSRVILGGTVVRTVGHNSAVGVETPSISTNDATTQNTVERSSRPQRIINPSVDRIIKDFYQGDSQELVYRDVTIPVVYTPTETYELHEIDCDISMLSNMYDLAEQPVLERFNAVGLQGFVSEFGGQVWRGFSFKDGGFDILQAEGGDNLLDDILNHDFSEPISIGLQLYPNRSSGGNIGHAFLVVKMPDGSFYVIDHSSSNPTSDMTNGGTATYYLENINVFEKYISGMYDTSQFSDTPGDSTLESEIFVILPPDTLDTINSEVILANPPMIGLPENTFVIRATEDEIILMEGGQAVRYMYNEETGMWDETTDIDAGGNVAIGTSGNHRKIDVVRSGSNQIIEIKRA